MNEQRRAKIAPHVGRQSRFRSFTLAWQNGLAGSTISSLKLMKRAVPYSRDETEADNEHFDGKATNRKSTYLPTTVGVWMYYIVETNKSFSQASADLESAVKRHGFGVLYVHDLGAALRSKGLAFKEDCKVFEVCNPAQAAKVLSTDMRLNMALPCRISLFTEQGKTKLGLIRPVQMLSALSQDAALLQVAQEVEETTIQMVDEAK